MLDSAVHANGGVSVVELLHVAFLAGVTLVRIGALLAGNAKALETVEADAIADVVSVFAAVLKSEAQARNQTKDKGVQS